MILEAIYGYSMHRMNSEKFYNLSYEPKGSTPLEAVKNF